MATRLLVILALFAVACGPTRRGDDEEDPVEDASTSVTDSGPHDGGHFDGGVIETDAGDPDGGDFDGGDFDGGDFDGGEFDGGDFDGGEFDGGGFNGGGFDGGGFDGGGFDGGWVDPDAGPIDAGPIDAGPVDAGPFDAGPVDAGPFDAGPVDGGSLGGEACTSARVVNLVAGTTRLAGESTTFATNDIEVGSSGNCTPTGGPDLVYVMSVPAGRRLRATATPLDEEFDVALNVIAAPVSRCASPVNVCAAFGADTNVLGEPETVTYLNLGTAAETVFVVVDTSLPFFGDATGGRFDLELSLETPPAGDTCASATRLDAATGSVTLTAQSTAGYANDFGTGSGCVGTYGRDRVYVVNVPAQRQISVLATTAGDNDVSIAFVDGAVCDTRPRTCLASVDNTGAGIERANWLNRGSAAKDVYVVVDSRRSEPNTFDLVFTVEPPPSNDTCASATTVTLPAALNGDTFSANDDYASTTCSGSSGAEVVYRALVPAGKGLRASVRPANGETRFDPSIGIVAGSAATCESAYACVDSDDSGMQETTNSVRWTNPEPTAQAVFIVVDSFSSVGGAFFLEASLVDPAPGDVCSTAITLAPGATVNGSTVNAANDYGTGTGCASTTGEDVAYAVTVPPGKQLLATVTAADGYQPTLNFTVGAAAACAANRTCQSSASVESGTNQATLAFANDGSVPVAGFLIVEAVAGDTGTFQLATSLVDVRAGETCATAERLSPNTSVTGTTQGFANNFGPGTGCSGTSGPDRMYVVDVPAGKVLDVTVTPVANFDPSLQLVESPASRCAAPRTCLVGRDGTTGPEKGTWANRTSAMVSVFIVVDSYDDAFGQYGLQATISDPPPIPPGDVCTSAPVLTLSSTPTTVTNTLVGAYDDYDSETSGCHSGPAPDVFFAVTIPPGKTLRATATPLRTAANREWDIALQLVLGACPAKTAPCTIGKDSGLDGASDTLTYANATSAPVTGHIVVDSYYSAPERIGPFTLEVTLTP